MNIRWSHAVLNVRNLDDMLDFYSGVLGLTVSDRGPLGRGGDTEIVFMSNDPDEHHQLAMVPMRNEDTTGNPLNHLAFRVETFEEVKETLERLQTRDGTKVMPLSHGNTLSIYFSDPEGNGLEVFWDTPWHVAQPQGKPWDTNLDRDAALAWVEDTFKEEASFAPRGEASAPFVNRKD